MSYVNIIYVFFLVRRKISSLFFRLGMFDHISNYCPLSSQILSYINIFNINRNLLTHGCKICCVRSLTNAQESFKLVLILPIFYTFSVNSQNTFLSADFCMQ